MINWQWGRFLCCFCLSGLTLVSQKRDQSCMEATGQRCRAKCPSKFYTPWKWKATWTTLGLSCRWWCARLHQVNIPCRKDSDCDTFFEHNMQRLNMVQHHIKFIKTSKLEDLHGVRVHARFYKTLISWPHTCCAQVGSLAKCKFLRRELSNWNAWFLLMMNRLKSLFAGQEMCAKDKDCDYVL